MKLLDIKPLRCFTGKHKDVFLTCEHTHTFNDLTNTQKRKRSYSKSNKSYSSRSTTEHMIESHDCESNNYFEKTVK